MSSLDLLNGPLGTGLAAVLGLLVGSFLNVVIHRLPKMMERQWACECAELLKQPAPEQAPLTLLHPRSRCPSCGTPVRAHQNIPVLSYLWLRGKCHACKAPIGIRYPLVELLTGVLFACAFQLHGPSVAALAWFGYVAAIVALAFIDWDTTLLPDSITLPLVWAGLVGSTLGLTAVPLTDAFWGAVAGYLSLWSVYWVFKLLTGKEGMGYGDFKLFAALGAWFGWQALIPMILMASVLGAVVGIALKLRQGLREGGYVPFGPFLAFAGLFAMVFGPQSFLHWIGL
ncbi:MAG TPA: A24 family peptidase [Macromonas sp.]|nr:A24 family peptidase [Macromonas sp.]